MLLLSSGRTRRITQRTTGWQPSTLSLETISRYIHDRKATRSSQYSFTKGNPRLTNFTNSYEEEITGLDMGEEEWKVSTWMSPRTSVLSYIRCPQTSC